MNMWQILIGQVLQKKMKSVSSVFGKDFGLEFLILRNVSVLFEMSKLLLLFAMTILVATVSISIKCTVHLF